MKKLKETITTLIKNNLLDVNKLKDDIENLYTTNSGSFTLTDKLLNELTLLFPFLSVKVSYPKALGFSLLIDRSGNLVDFVKLLNVINIKGKNDIFNNYQLEDLEVNKVNYTLFNWLYTYNGYDSFSDLHFEFKRYNFNINNFLSFSLDLDNNVKNVETLANKYLTNLDKIIKNIEKSLVGNRFKDGENFKTKRLELVRYYALYKLNSLVLKILYEYINVISYIVKDNLSSERIATTLIPDSKLYHLSESPNLGILNENDLDNRSLNPKTPLTGFSQSLPPRICFAPDPLLCCYGIPHRFSIKNKDVRVEGEFAYKQIYLYEGIPEKGKTRFIKNPYIVAEVSEGMFSKEIAVTTPIKVKLLGKIEIKYRHKLDIDDFRKFIEWKFIN